MSWISSALLLMRNGTRWVKAFLRAAARSVGVETEIDLALAGSLGGVTGAGGFAGGVTGATAFFSAFSGTTGGPSIAGAGLGRAGFGAWGVEGGAAPPI